jgi:hypothetical protein
MDRIANGTQVAALPTPDVPSGTPGYFGRTTDGAPGPTRVGRDWLNQITEEIRNVIVAAGITPAYNVFTQLLAAIRTLAGQAIPAVTDTGAANHYVITPTPALAALAGGVAYRVKFTHANTGASDIVVSGLPAAGLVRHDGTALQLGDIPLNSEGVIICDGTKFQLTDSTGLLVGDSGGGGVAGLVPPPAAGDATASKFLSAAGIWAAIVAFVGDSGVGGVKGLVPAPAAGDAAAQKVLAAGGGFARARYQSAPQAVAPAVSMAHGLGGQPWDFTARLICISAEFGYSVGDEVNAPGTTYTQGGGGAGSWGAPWADPVNVGY